MYELSQQLDGAFSSKQASKQAHEVITNS